MLKYLERFKAGRLWRQLIAQPMHNIGAQGGKLEARSSKEGAGV